MTVNESMLIQILKAWASHLPGLIALAGALILILVKWRLAPRASLLAMIGVLINLVMALVLPAVYVWLPQYFMRSSGTPGSDSLGRAYLVLNVGASVIYALGYALIICAVYTERRRD